MLIDRVVRRLALCAAVGAAVAVALPGAALAQKADSVTKVVTPQLDFSGLMFGSFSYRSDSATKAANGGKERSSFNLDRAYLTFRLPAGDDASIRVTTDLFQQSPSSYYAGWALRLKYAYVQFNFLHDIGDMKGFNAVARVGMLHTVAVDHYETFWPRFLGQAGIEQNGFFSSSDMGAALLVTLPGKWGEVYSTITNGSGYTSGETDRFKDLALRVSLTPFATEKHLFSTFTISPWFYTGRKASAHQNDALPATLGPVAEGLKNDRFGILVGNRDRRLTFGLDWGQRTETFESGANTAGSPLVTADTSGTLTGAFVVARPAELLDNASKSKWGVLVRFDNFVPKSGSTAGTGGSAPSQQRAVAGLFWEPNARNTIALDYQGLTHSNYTPAAQPAVQSTIFVHWYVTF